MPYEKFNIIRGKPEETLQLWARKFEFLFNKNLNVDNVVSTGLIVPADLVTVDDTGGYFASSNANVEDVLQQIGSTLQNIPAGNVKIVDSGTYYTSTSVEGALQEIANFSLSGKTRVTTKTASATLTTTEFGVIICNSTVNITLGLPTAVGNLGYSYFITNINSGVATIDPDGTETIFGDTGFDVYQDENIQTISNNTVWVMR